MLDALKYSRATSFALMCLIFTVLDFSVAGLLTMYLSISVGEIDKKRSGPVYLLNSFATSRLQYLGFASSCLLVSIHLTLIGMFPFTSLHFETGTFL